MGSAGDFEGPAAAREQQGLSTSRRQALGRRRPSEALRQQLQLPVGKQQQQQQQQQSKSGQYS